MGSLHCLKNIALFSQLSDAELATVAAAGIGRRVQAGQFLFAAGDPAVEVFIVKCGRVKVYSLDPEGRSFTLSLAGPNALVGQEAAFCREWYSVYAEAVEPSDLWVFSRAALVEVLRIHPDLALNAVRALSARLADTEERLAQLALGDVKSRTLHTLRRLAAEDGLPTDGGLKLRRRWTHQELSDLISASRPTVTSVLRELQLEGLIRIDSRRIVVCEHQAATNGNGGALRVGA